MFRLLLLALYLTFLIGCAVNAPTRNNLPIISDANIEAKFSATGRDAFSTILRYKIDEHPYQLNNSVLVATSFANHNNHDARASGAVLAKQHYLPLLNIQADQLHFSIEYATGLECIAENLTTAEASEKMSVLRYFATNVLQQFSRNYQVTLRLTPKSAFFNAHIVNPALNDLIFYVAADCDSTKALSWYLHQYAAVLHELSHIEQYWGNSAEAWLATSATLTHQQLNMDKLLREFSANQLEACSTLMADAFHWSQYSLPDSSVSLTDVANKLLQQTNQSEFSMYSMLGAVLANLWLAEFADEEGYISKKNNSQYSLVEQACTGVITKAGISMAARSLAKLLEKNAGSNVMQPQFTQ